MLLCHPWCGGIAVKWMNGNFPLVCLTEFKPLKRSKVQISSLNRLKTALNVNERIAFQLAIFCLWLSRVWVKLPSSANVKVHLSMYTQCYVQPEGLAIVLESSLLLIYLDFQSVIVFLSWIKFWFSASLQLLIHMHFLLYFLVLISF